MERCFYLSVIQSVYEYLTVSFTYKSNLKKEDLTIHAVEQFITGVRYARSVDDSRAVTHCEFVHCLSVRSGTYS